MAQQVSVGVGTKYGIFFSLIAAAKPVVDEIVALVENTSAQFSTADKVSLISGATIAGVTILGRFAQAVAKIIREG